MTEGPRPIRDARERWLQARRAVSAANAVPGDGATRAFAIRLLNKRRARYHRICAIGLLWLMRRQRQKQSASPDPRGHQRAV